MTPRRVGDVSFWYADLGGPPERRAPLPGDVAADVCIIGAGYTGLWAAYYLNQLDPGLDIVVVEKEFAGFGASGRNGGWLTGGFSWNHTRYQARSDADAVKRFVQMLTGTVDEVISVAEAHGIDADILRTDELMVATNPAQLARARAETAHRQHWGEDRVGFLSATETAERLHIPGSLGAMIVGGVARVQPAKLVRGLAEVVARKGIRIAEGTTVTHIAPGRVTTDYGRVTARYILRCTEGFTTTLPGLRRDWLPLNSAQIVTEPLPPHVWDAIGWKGHEILGDFKNAYCYCQRTREGRITVGARGTPYKFGSAIDKNGTPDAATIARLTDILHTHFPAARGAAIDHAWCGVLGVPRDWCATVGLGHDGIGWGGGYVGVGVSTSNLAGRTLAALVTGRDPDGLSRLPWVNKQVRPWEPEPLRWLGVRGMYAILNMADRGESRGGDMSRLAQFANWLTGRH